MIRPGDFGRQDPPSRKAEQWLAERMVADPAVLGLGELDVSVASSAFRQVSLVAIDESSALWVVELQLGIADDRSILRVIERWLLQRKRHPAKRCSALFGAGQFPPRDLQILELLSTALPLRAVELRIANVAGSFAVQFSPVVLR